MENKRTKSNKKYNEKNREILSKKRKERYNKNKEQEIQYSKDYYEKNKELVLARNKEWRKNNRETFNNILYARRKEVAKELKEQGQMYVYRPKTDRENRMIKYLSNKRQISLEESKQKLIENNWNIKKILGED